jgi:deaminated glutathione amidase
MRAAVVQFTSGPDLDRNVERMEKLLEEAARAGAKLVVFPEHAYLYSERAVWLRALPRFKELLDRFSGWAKRHQVFLLPGSVREPLPNLEHRFCNTAPLFGPDGGILAQYRKIFLFQATLPDRVYKEAEDCEAGKAIVTAPIDGHRLGLSICYDLRFPELFRGLKKQGASIVALPSAFTVPTGEAHWDVLTRARAIENQVFFLAPGQVGVLGNGAATYGHSRIISPWGEVLAEVGGGEGIAVADLDPQLCETAKRRVDAWGCRREDLFPIA